MGSNPTDPNAAQAATAVNIYAESSYPLSDDQQLLWQRAGAALVDSDIARVWARLDDRGIHLGPAIGAQIDKVGSDQVPASSLQYFSGGYISMVTGLDASKNPLNPNKSATAYDARGVVGSDSGL